jgi:hypothetical protein
MELMRELTDSELDAVAGGVAVATAGVMSAASGPNATATGGLTAETIPTYAQAFSFASVAPSGSWATFASTMVT